MKIDLRQLLYSTYLKHSDCQVEIHDKFGNLTIGYVSGIYLDQSEGQHPEIIKWHIVQKEDRYNLGVNALGFMKGVVVEQKDVKRLKFENDSLEFKFEE